MGEDTPLLRVSTLRSTVAVLRDQTFGERALNDVPAHVLDGIAESSRTGLVPAEYGLAITNAVHVVAGDVGVIALNRAIVRNASDIPLFRPLLQGALNVFGSGPKGLMNGLRNGVKASGRNTPLVESEGTGERSLRSTWSGIHEVLRVHPWLIANVGTILGMLDLAGVEGQVDVDERRFYTEGVAVYDARW